MVSGHSIRRNYLVNKTDLNKKIYRLQGTRSGRNRPIRLLNTVSVVACRQRRRGSGNGPDRTESQKKNTSSNPPVNNRTEVNQMTKASQNIEMSTQNEYNASDLHRIRTASSSSLGSLRSIQSFYSAKSGDEDFYSVCSDNSVKEPS